MGKRAAADKLEILVPDQPSARPAGRSPIVPVYRGAEWVEAELPVTAQDWPVMEERRLLVSGMMEPGAPRADLRAYAARKPWVLPKRTVNFISDVHADGDALITSLIASGGIEKTGPADLDFEVTPEGRGAIFVIGGDCFDKGPENLRVLDLLRALRRKGAEVEILAGNHDVRLAVGLTYAFERDDPRLAHLFVRLGSKAVPLFKEVYDRYVAPTRRRRFLGERAARERLFPYAGWYADYPKIATAFMRPEKVQREVRRTREKAGQMEEAAEAAGLGFGQIHAVVEKCRALLLEPQGEFGWFFQSMNLAYRSGSFLFLHAGVDDVVAGTLRREGVAGLNRRFRALMQRDLFELYNGPVGNAFRTRYRATDWPLTPNGVSDLHRCGLYAIVHGHRSLASGQRMILRNGVLHVECDATLDRNTRAREGLGGHGGAVTILHPDGRILGISTDYPHVKAFDPTQVCDITTIV